MFAPNSPDKSGLTAGFTLIELSIVLVIIGLIVGGVLVGRDLISAAAVRAQISQIEKYQTAVNTFRSKYGYLPGDVPNPAASQYGLLARGQYAGEGDGNGVIEGIDSDGAVQNDGAVSSQGETAIFWADLSSAKLIEGNFNSASATGTGVVTTGMINNIGLILPSARLGNGNYVYVWSGGINYAGPNTGDENNYFGLASVLGISGSWSVVSPTGSLSVSQAYNIDNKIDDGLPISGRVNVMFPVSQSSPGSVIYSFKSSLSDSNPFDGINYTIEPTNQPENPNSTTCYDNNHVTGAVMHYSMSVNNGAGMNCALSFRFQ